MSIPYIDPDGVIRIQIRGNKWMSMKLISVRDNRWDASYYHRSRCRRIRNLGVVQGVNSLEGYDEMVELLLKRDLVGEARRQAQEALELGKVQ